MKGAFAAIVAVTCFASAVQAATDPTLNVSAPPAAEAFEARLVAPDGSTVWSCEADRRNEQSTLRCPESNGWWRGEGRYALVARVKSTAKKAEIVTIHVDTFDDDKTIHLAVAEDPKRTRVHRPAPAGIRLEPAADRALEFEFINESRLAIYSSFGGNPSKVRLERQTPTGWEVVGDDHVEEMIGDTAYASGERVRVSAPHDAEYRLSTGTYRLVAGGQLGKREQPRWDSTHIAPVSEFEVASPPFVWPPEKTPLACAPHWYELRPPPVSSYAEYRQLLRTPRGLLLVKGSGEILEMEKSGYPVLSRIPEGTHVLARPDDASRLFYVGTKFGLSSDGGLTWKPLAGPALPVGTSVALAGTRLLQYGIDGRAFWREADGTMTEISLPVRGAWRGAAFRDELHGVLIGDCSLLIETKDGGKTWAQSFQPRLFLSQAQWQGNDLVLAGTGGIYRRRATQASIEQVFEAKSCYIRQNREPLTAGCTLEKAPGGASSGVLVFADSHESAWKVRTINAAVPWAPYYIDVGTDGSLHTLGHEGVFFYPRAGEPKQLFEASHIRAQKALMQLIESLRPKPPPSSR
jgi:hypothetical protein